MGKTDKRTRKSAPPKAGKRTRLVDLSPKDTRQVKGGATTTTGWDLQKNAKV